MTKQEILTVLIPTRDRADTLIHALHTVTAQANPNIEIIVSDNFSGPEVKEVVDAVTDPRVRYIRTPERLGMSEHWDWALNHVKGDWLTILGDDDGLIPGAVDKFFAMRAKHPDVKAITTANCWYRWPSVSKDDGKICIISGKGYEVRDCKEYIIRTLKGDRVSQPSIYTGGFVAMEVVNKAKAAKPDGLFFRSMNPDVYSGMAISSVTDKYIYSWESWCIAGASKHSNGRAHKYKTPAEIKQLAFHQESHIPFPPELGETSSAFVGSMHIYIYECYLQSRHLRDYDLNIDLGNQLALFILHASKRTRPLVIEYCKQVAQINNLPFEPILQKAKLQKPAYRVKKIGSKIARHLPGVGKLPRKVIVDDSVKNVYDAAEKIAQELAA